MDQNELLQAIRTRRSVRRYDPRALAPDAIEALQAEIDRINREGRLHAQLILNEPKGFNGVFAYGKFSGVTNYIVMAGPKGTDLDERIGYYGEMLVLLAQHLGLNTCWAGLSYTKVAGTYTLLPGEKIACYIALGYGLTQGADHKRRTPQEVSNVSEATPEWFLKGVEAALLGPTAINQQKFRFEYLGGRRVRAHKGFSLIGYTSMDMGIARLHFEIGAGVPVEWV